MRFVGYLGSLAATFLGLTAVTFSIGRFIPVDPVLAIVGDHATRAGLRSRSPGNRARPSIPEQYPLYLGRVLHGDFGHSVMTSNPVLSDLMHFFPATLELATVATIIGVALGVPAGVAAGAMQGALARSFRPLLRLVRLFHAGVLAGARRTAGCSTPSSSWVAGPGRIDIGFDDIVEPRTGVLLIDSAHRGRMGRVPQCVRASRAARRRCSATSRSPISRA